MNGGLPKRVNAKVPRTPAEVTADGLACIAGGAAIVHAVAFEQVLAERVHVAPFLERPGRTAVRRNLEIHARAGGVEEARFVGVVRLDAAVPIEVIGREVRHHPDVRAEGLDAGELERAHLEHDPVRLLFEARDLVERGDPRHEPEGQPGLDGIRHAAVGGKRTGHVPCRLEHAPAQKVAFGLGVLEAFVEIDGVTQPNVAPRFSVTESEIQGPPCEDLGVDTDSVLADFGFSEDEIAGLKAREAI